MGGRGVQVSDARWNNGGSGGTLYKFGAFKMVFVPIEAVPNGVSEREYYSTLGFRRFKFLREL